MHLSQVSRFAILVNAFSSPTKQYQSTYIVAVLVSSLCSFRYFKWVLFAFSSSPIYTTYICLPDVDSPPPPEIMKNPKFFLFFADTIGAIDGTHITCHPSGEDWHATWDHKGNFSQNCLVACSFNLPFTYMLSSWEGSAADARTNTLYDVFC